jgi:hypothetical protein
VEDEDQSKRAPSGDASDKEGNINDMQLVVTDNMKQGPLTLMQMAATSTTTAHCKTAQQTIAMITC